MTRTQLQDMDDVALIEKARKAIAPFSLVDDPDAVALIEELVARFEPFAETPDGYSFTNHRKFPNPPETETTL